MANTHEHLEHAEHAGHHAEDPFNKRVAVSMAIVAACLAGIAMFGHRTHNQVLQLQSDANRVGTEAAAAEVEKSNAFAWYQAKRLRQAQYQTLPELAAVLKPELAAAADAAAKKAKENRMAPADKSAAPPGKKEKPPTLDAWAEKVEEYNDPNDPDSLPNIQKRGAEAGERAKKLKAGAKALRDEAEHVHHQADRFDIAHLLAEIGLVVCSIALLTKKKAYWFIGVTAAALAIGVGVSARFITHHPAAESAAGSSAH